MTRYDLAMNEQLGGDYVKVTDVVKMLWELHNFEGTLAICDALEDFGEVFEGCEE